MAEINMQLKNSRRKIQAPRVDLTPMVDLGFLLITFFIFTTTMAKPKTMAVDLPFKPAPANGTKYPEESTITVIPTKDHKLACYYGALADTTQLLLVKFNGTNNIRDILIKKQKQAAALPASYSADAHKLHVIIKPDDSCTYEDVVSILDEMSILQVPHFAIDYLTPGEKAWLKRGDN